MAIVRNSKGQFLPGHCPNPTGRPRKGGTIGEIIRAEFSEDMEIYIDNHLTRRERVTVMAQLLAQLITTAQIVFPDRKVNGVMVPGKVYDYSPEDWVKYVIRVLHYVEPPVTNINVSNEVEGIVFDKDIGADADGSEESDGSDPDEA